MDLHVCFFLLKIIYFLLIHSKFSTNSAKDKIFAFSHEIRLKGVSNGSKMIH